MPSAKTSSITNDAARKPKISVIVIIYNIEREARRTLFSLSAEYQRHILPQDYEVLVVDNGSNPAFDPSTMSHLQGNFRYLRTDPAPPSPAAAINLGISEAKGSVVGVMIDGARIASPGLIHFARHGTSLYERAIVATMGWYIGGDFQRFAQQYGYDSNCEDTLLRSIDWPNDGYRLFDISAYDESSVDGWFYPLQESNALFMKRELWALIDNVDERFMSAGGGLLNLDTYRRAMDIEGAELVILLGEGTFHQIHNGIATNATPDQLSNRLAKWQSEYFELRGRHFENVVPPGKPTYVGTLSHNALKHFTHAAIDPIRPGAFGVEPPLGREFDTTIWTSQPIQPALDPRIAAVVDLAHREMQAKRPHTTASLARILRARAPEEPEPLRLTALLGAAAPEDRLSPDLGQQYHAVLAEGFALLGENENAQAHRQLAGLPAGYQSLGPLARVRRAASRVHSYFLKS